MITPCCCDCVYYARCLMRGDILTGKSIACDSFKPKENDHV